MSKEAPDGRGRFELAAEEVLRQIDEDWRARGQDALSGRVYVSIYSGALLAMAREFDRGVMPPAVLYAMPYAFSRSIVGILATAVGDMDNLDGFVQNFMEMLGEEIPDAIASARTPGKWVKADVASTS